jgi:hypothetical protein
LENRGIWSEYRNLENRGIWRMEEFGVMENRGIGIWR